MSDRVEDAVAEKLEAARLWRRAATRWLVVMERFTHTDVQREWIRQRRQYCQSMIVPVATASEKLDIVAINKAANAVQAKMGIAQPNGAMFRTYSRQKKHKKNAKSHEQ